MPALAEILARRAGVALEALQDTAFHADREVLEALPDLEKRVLIPCCNDTSPSGLVEATTVDPWRKSGKYALGWVYFSIILLVLTAAIRWYNFWNDKVRTAMHKDRMEELIQTGSPDTDYELSALSTDKSTRKFFPREGPLPSTATEAPKESSAVTSSRFLNVSTALVRWVFYRPLPTWRIKNGWRPIVFPSIGAIAIVLAALTFVILYCFVPQPLYWQSIRFGSPPLAIRSGMIAVAMMPWIVALSMKANFISMVTGIGHERLNVLHRWLAYICLLLSLIHTIPFYVTPIWEKGALRTFRTFFQNTQGYYVYGSGEWKHEALYLTEFESDPNRHCRSRTLDLPLRSFASATPSSILRALRHRSCPGLDRPDRHALLALSQLPHVLELSVCDNRHLGCIICSTIILSELDQSLADVLADWGGGRRHLVARERDEDYRPDTSEMEARAICLHSNAWNLGVRESPFHHCFALQR